MRKGGFDAALPVIAYFWQSTQARRPGTFLSGRLGAACGVMKKWWYALFGWVAWKVIKRVARRKLPLSRR
jgi:type IV secretory pathway TrbD component